MGIGGAVGWDVAGERDVGSLVEGELRPFDVVREVRLVEGQEGPPCRQRRIVDEDLRRLVHQVSRQPLEQVNTCGIDGVPRGARPESPA